MYRIKGGFNIRLSFIPFGDTILGGYIPLTVLNSDLRNRILNEINTGDAQKTDFAIPFSKAKEIFKSSPQKSKRLIVLFTDGIPDLQRENKSVYPSDNEVLTYFNTSRIKVLVDDLTNLNVCIEVVGVNERLYGMNLEGQINPNYVKKRWDDLLQMNIGSFYLTSPDILEPISLVNGVLTKSLFNTHTDWQKLNRGANKFSLGASFEMAFLTIIKSNPQNDIVVIKNNKEEKQNPLIIGRNNHYILYSSETSLGKNFIADFNGDGETWLGISPKYRQSNYELKNKVIEKSSKPNIQSTDYSALLLIFLSLFVLSIAILWLLLKNKLEKLKKENIERENKLIVENETLGKKLNESLVEKNIFHKEREKLIQQLEESSIELKREKERASTLYQKDYEQKSKEAIEKNSKEIHDILTHPTRQSVNKAIDILKKFLSNFKQYELYHIEKISGLSKSFANIYSANQKISADNNFKNIEFIFKIIKKESYSSVLLNEASKFFWNTRWKDRLFDQVISDIYNIIENLNEPGPLLSYIVETGKQQKANRIVNIMTRIYYWNKEEALEDDLINYMAEIQKAYWDFNGTVLGGIGFSLFDGLIKLYEDISKTPYPTEIEFPDIENLENDWKIRRWEITIFDCKNILDDIKKLEHNLILKSFESKINYYNKGTNLKFPEMKILSVILEKWYMFLKNVALSPVNIECQFVPLLTIDEEVCQNLKCSKFSIMLINNSNGEAYNFKVKLKKDGRVISEDDSSILFLSKQETKLTKLFKVENFLEEYEIEYSYDAYDSNTKKSKTYSYELNIMDNSIKKRKKKITDNPYRYIANNPYKKNTPYMQRNDVETKFLKNLKIDDSDIFHILGMRGIGKTSLINYIANKLSKEGDSDNTIIIKIQCENYLCKDENNNYRIWTSLDLLGNIAREIERVFEGRFFENFKIAPPKNGGMSLEDFRGFILEVMRRKNPLENLVLVFDDADILEKTLYIEDKKIELFPDLMNLIDGYLRNLLDDIKFEYGGSLYIVFSGWKDVMGETWSKITTLANEKNIYLQSFNKEKVRELANWGGVEYNNISFEYLWRVSGGFPQITLLLCKMIFDQIEKLEEPERNFNSVPLSILQRVVNEIISNEKYWTFFNYIIVFGLPKCAYKDFFNLLKISDEKTFQFSAENFKNKNFKILKDCEFIDLDQKSDRGIIKTGIFKLFINSKERLSNHNFFKDKLEIEIED